jgi:hypothetical protein
VGWGLRGWRFPGKSEWIKIEGKGVCCSHNQSCELEVCFESLCVDSLPPPALRLIIAHYFSISTRAPYRIAFQSLFVRSWKVESGSADALFTEAECPSSGPDLQPIDPGVRVRVRMRVRVCVCACVRVSGHELYGLHGVHGGGEGQPEVSR